MPVISGALIGLGVGKAVAIGIAGAAWSTIAAVGLQALNHFVLTDTPGLRDPTREQDITQGLPGVPHAYNQAYIQPIVLLPRDADPDRSQYADHWCVYGFLEGKADRIEKVWLEGKEVEFSRVVTTHGSGYVLKGTGSDWGPDGRSKNVGNWPKFQFYEVFDGDGTYTFPVFEYNDVVGGAKPGGQESWEWNTTTHSLKHIVGGLGIFRERVGKIKDPNPPRNRVYKSYPSPGKWLYKITGINPIVYPKGDNAEMLTTPEVTGSPAALIYDYLRTHLRVTDNVICHDCVAKSDKKCRDDVTYTEAQLPDEYLDRDFTRTTKRYLAGGIWTTKTSATNILNQLSQCMAGFVVRGLDAKIHPIAAGTGEVVIDNLTGDDLIDGEYSESLGGPLEQKRNVFKLKMARSDQNNGGLAVVPTWTDTAAQERDGTLRRNADNTLVLDKDGNPIFDKAYYEEDYGTNIFLYDELVATRVLRRLGLEKSRLTHTITFRLPKYVEENGKVSDKYLRLTPHKSHIMFSDPKRGRSTPRRYMVLNTVLERTARTQTEPPKSWIRVTVVDYDTDIDVDDLKLIPSLHPLELDAGILSVVPTPQNVKLAQIPGTRYARLTFTEVPVAVDSSTLWWRVKVPTGDEVNDWTGVDVSYGDEIDFSSTFGTITIEYYLIHGFGGQYSQDSPVQEFVLKEVERHNGTVPANRCPATNHRQCWRHLWRNRWPSLA